MASATATDSDGRILLPNFVVAKLYAKRQDGRKVYMTCTGSLVCEHGETAGTITYWTAMEARARAEGRSPPKRGRAGVSVCDCQSSAGLVCRSINRSKSNSDISSFSSGSHMNMCWVHSIVWSPFQIKFYGSASIFIFHKGNSSANARVTHFI